MLVPVTLFLLVSSSPSEVQIILHGRTAFHHGDQEAGKEYHEEDHELKSLADLHGAKSSRRLNQRPSTPPLQLQKAYPLHIEKVNVNLFC